MLFLRRRGNVTSEVDIPRLNVMEEGAGQNTDVDEQMPTDHAPHPAARSPSIEIDSLVAATSAQDTGDDSPLSQDDNRRRRFSILRFRNASDSQLSLRAKQHADQPPPVPRPPHIIKTSPTIDMDVGVARKKPSRIRLAGHLRKSADVPRTTQEDSSKNTLRLRRRKTAGNGNELREEPDPMPSRQQSRPRSSTSHQYRPLEESSAIPPLPDGNLPDSQSTEALEVTKSQSLSRSSTPSFFRLTRRKTKQPEPLFPIAHLAQNGKGSGLGVKASDALSPHSAGSAGDVAPALALDESSIVHPRPGSKHSDKASRIVSPQTALRTTPSPATAFFRPSSTHSGQSSPTRTHIRLRGRSSTMSSAGRESLDDHLAPPGTTRTSTSTGRKSFGDLFGLGRLRQNSDLTLGRQGTLTPVTPGSNTSKNNSLQLVREAIPLPERRDDDTPAKYLARLEEVMSRGVIASALSKGTDSFSAAVLRSYMRSFLFFGDPMDMAIRKLLMEAELPKETQQIDRCLQAFANRYHECNPGIYESPDQAYFIAFSLLILHTDVFNKNNKHKMQKVDYLKNTRGEGIFDEILDCFYDNITYTPFIHVEDDLDSNGDRGIAHKTKRKTLFPGSTAPDNTRRPSKEPLDPYTLIIDSKLDILRPTLKDVMNLEDHYSYLGTAKVLNLRELQTTFFRTGILQIVSPRSRPDAFMTEKTATNPEEAHPGIVDIKITKVGLLWRKDAKKKKTRSPWQEWGAILTGAQLYFFRNTAWIKSLMHQYESHIKQGHEGVPIIFKPPLELFKPDALISTDGAVALLDSSYKKHKHAFVYVRHGGFEEVLLADGENEMNDWLAKLNYAAAFRTSGVRMRGVVGGNYEGQSRRGIRRLDNSDATQSIQTPTGEVTIARGRIDHKMAEDILAARRDIMVQKIAEAEEKLATTQRQLDVQLRNARHLQILAPIQPKTRDQLLLAAAKLSAQLKWTRTEIWKVRCHRDILSLDLEDERLAFSDASGNSQDVDSVLAGPVDRHQTAAPIGEQPPVVDKQISGNSLAIVPVATVSASSNLSSPTTEEFMTPPTSARLLRYPSQPSLSSPDDLAGRKSSITSSVASSGPPVARASSGNAQVVADDDLNAPPVEQADEVDADERDLLAKSGLVTKGVSHRHRPNAVTASNEQPDLLEGRDVPLTAEKQERNKIRRSLQRTLREGAGHLSHHRGRKGKDSASSGASNEKGNDDKLARGSGSFVVHGKKASVINFGSELQTMSRDESLRQRKQQPLLGDPGPSSSPARPFEEEASPHSIAMKSRGRRESAASVGTATALSFRDLHRKYSSSQAAGTGHGLAVQGDDDSDAAVSFSDGRRTPMLSVDTDSRDDAESLRAGRDMGRSHFFTPEPPASATSTGNNDEEDDELEPKDLKSISGQPIVVGGA